MTTNLGNRGLGWYRLVVAILGAGLLTLWLATSASAATRSSLTGVADGIGPTVALLGPTADLSVCSRAGDGDMATPRTLVLNYQNWAAPAGAFLPTSTYDVQDDGYDCLSALSPREPGSASVRAPPQQAIRLSLGPLAPSGCIRVAANSERLLAKADRIEQHLTRLDHSPANDAMLARIRGAATSGSPLSRADRAFMRHESTEAWLMDRGVGYGPAHRIAGWTHPTFGNYDPSVIKQFPEYFGSGWKRYWGIE